MSETTLFKVPTQLPEPKRQVIVVFVDRTMLSHIEYCSKCEAWHSPEGNLKPNRIHQWAYADEFYDSIGAPKPEKVEGKLEDMDKDELSTLLKLLFISAVVKGRKHPVRFP